tara:strand:- start:78 stop:467 length:390 start_codon:yes stop_codon:yes gene_type:complete
MKKHYLQLSITVLLIIFSFISCSDEEEENFDLVGVWNRTMILENGVNIIDDCQNKDIINFSANGTLFGEYYYYENGICELNDTQNDTWELSNNTLIIGNGNIVNITFTNKDTFKLSENGDTEVEIWERN